MKMNDFIHEYYIPTSKIPSKNVAQSAIVRSISETNKLTLITTWREEYGRLRFRRLRRSNADNLCSLSDLPQSFDHQHWVNIPHNS